MLLSCVTKELLHLAIREGRLTFHKSDSPFYLYGVHF